MPSLRRHPRFALAGKVRVSWENDHREGVTFTAQLVDISLDGMQLSCTHPVPTRQMVRFQFRFKDKQYEGMASVRACVRTELLYRVGVEFCNGFQWKFPQDSEPLSAVG